MVNIGNEWDNIIGEEFNKPYYLKLRQFLKSEYSSQKIQLSSSEIHCLYGLDKVYTDIEM